MPNLTHARPFFPNRLTLGSVLAFALSLGLAAPPAAHATDGVAEINHTCAVQTGCFPGDSAGYPITIDGQAGRSYLLTSDLIVPNENTHGIDVAAPNISIDLGGFAIARSGCVEATSNCTPASGSGSGVTQPGLTYRGASVKNGSIIGMGLHGVTLGEQAEVTNLRVRWNRNLGIRTDAASIIRGNTVYQNAGFGIMAGPGSTISENTSNSNVWGIVAGIGSSVSENVSYANSNDGIIAGTGCNVHHNTVKNNGGYGLNLGLQVAYSDNVITNNADGAIQGASGAVNMGGNSCNGTATCP